MHHATGGPPHGSTADRAALQVQRLSWAGIRVVLGNTSLVLDAWTNTAAWDGLWTEPVAPVESDYKSRIALITNVLNDHFDPVAVRAAIGPRGAVICHDAVAPLVAGEGFRTRPVKLYEPLIVGDSDGPDLTIAAVPSVDGFGEDQVMWIVTGGGRRILHAGDAMWNGMWLKFGRQYGPFDAVFLPINGLLFNVRKPYSGIPATLTPEQAVAAALLLNAKRICPIHYGISDPGYYLEHPHALETFLTSAREHGIATEVLKPGEWMSWQAT